MLGCTTSCLPLYCVVEFSGPEALSSTQAVPSLMSEEGLFSQHRYRCVSGPKGSWHQATPLIHRTHSIRIEEKWLITDEGVGLVGASVAG